MNNGWIKLHRSLIDWEWYKDKNTLSVFLHLLLIANHEPNKWMGIKIGTGELITSREHLAKEVGLSIQSTRTALTKLKSTSEITITTTSKFTLIKLNNWEKYQTITSQLTINQPATNQQLTTNKKDKNNKNNIELRSIYFLKENNMETIYLDEYGEPITGQPIPKKYTSKKKLYSRIAVYYMALTGKTGNALRHFPAIKEIIEILEKDHPNLTEEQIEKEIKARIDIANSFYKSKNLQWGLGKVAENWEKILNWK